MEFGGTDFGGLFYPGGVPVWLDSLAPQPPAAEIPIPALEVPPEFFDHPDLTAFPFSAIVVLESLFETPVVPDMSWQQPFDLPPDDTTLVEGFLAIVIPESAFDVPLPGAYEIAGTIVLPEPIDDDLLGVAFVPLSEYVPESSVFAELPPPGAWMPALAEPVADPAATWVVDQFDLSSQPVFFFPVAADSLRLYLTGAGADGGTQADPDAALGNYRSATEAERVAPLVLRGVKNLTVGLASRANGADGTTGSIEALDANRVRYTGPGSDSPGGGVTVPAGQSRTLADGADPTQFIRVTRAATGNLRGKATIEFVDQLNNLFGLSNAAESESSAGGNRYRAVMVRNDGLATVNNLKFYIGTIAGSAISAGGGLPGSGAGTITGPAEAFCGWPQSGWARIETAAGALREIVYYSSRSDSVLTVPAGGRARLGTSAAAGATTDRVTSVPGIRIAWEDASPALNGAVQTIANESTAPTGVTWSTAVAAQTGVSVSKLETGRQGAIWIHRELPAGAQATAKAQNLIRVQYAVEGVTFNEPLAGLYRIADTDLRRLELHVGVNTDPDVTATPAETLAVGVGVDPESLLPWTPATQLTVGATNHIAVNFRNEYNLHSYNILTTKVRLDGSGNEVVVYPTAPTVISWESAGAGAFNAKAVYYYAVDGDNAATDWLIYLRTDGTDPDPSIDSPTVVAMAKADGAAYLNYTTGTYAGGTTGKVIVRVRRSSDSVSSQNLDVRTATADAAGPSSPTGRVLFRKVAEQVQ